MFGLKSPSSSPSAVTIRKVQQIGRSFAAWKSAMASAAYLAPHCAALPGFRFSQLRPPPPNIGRQPPTPPPLTASEAGGSAAGNFHFAPSARPHRHAWRFPAGLHDQSCELLMHCHMYIFLKTTLSRFVLIYLVGFFVLLASFIESVIVSWWDWLKILSIYIFLLMEISINLRCWVLMWGDCVSVWAFCLDSSRQIWMLHCNFNLEVALIQFDIFVVALIWTCQILRLIFLWLDSFGIWLSFKLFSNGFF